MKNSVSAQQAMADFDNATKPDGTPNIVSIKFWLNDGRIKYVPRAIKCGVKNDDMGGTDTKGVQPVDKENNKIGHPIPFKWYRVIEYKKQEVTL